MAIHQIDWCIRVPYPLNPSGWYYWTQVYYLDTADFATPNAMMNYCRLRAHASCINVVKDYKAQVKSEPGMGNVIATRTAFFGEGGSVPFTGPYQLINIGRARLYADDGRHSYRMLRFPIPDNWMQGDELNSTGYAWCQGFINAWIGTGVARNKHGGLYVSGEVDRKLHMWQLRHGTIRRERSPMVI